MTCEKSEFLKADGTRRVVITGMGAISPAGTGVDALWNAVYSGKQCIAPITRFDASEFAGSLAAEEGSAPLRAVRAVRHRRLGRGVGAGGHRHGG